MNILLLQAGAQGSPMGSLLLFAGMFAIMYFFMIRPQQKRQREQAQFANSLDKGKEVVTASGIIGRISKIEDDIITLEVGKVFIPFVRNAISKEMTDAYLKNQGADSKS